MSQQRAPEHRDRSTGSSRGAGQLIEKGWTVYDALERPIGNVTDIDTARNVLHLDGRAQGFDTYEVPLSFVDTTGNNEVRLSKAVDAGATAPGVTPRFVDQPATSATAGTSRVRARSRTEADAPGGPRSRTAGATADPATAETMREFTPPYATGTSATEPRATTPFWTTDDDRGWSAKKLAMAGLAFGGVAAASYVMRRRMRRKSAFERFSDLVTDYVDVASGYYDVASEFARNRHPAWWASLATAALPLAYYAWPSARPTPAEQARGRADDLSSYLAGLAGTLPWTPDSRSSMVDRLRHQLQGFERPAMWRPSGRGSTWDFSPRPDLAGTAGALAAGALGVYLLRRMIAKPRAHTRIADVMTRQPRVIQPDAMVADAAAIMRRMDVGALPVCDGTRLIGMLTDRDITVRATADGRDPHLTPVRDVMSPGIAWATEDDPVDAAARIMREHRIRRLPIVDERHSLVGVVSLGDLAVDVADDDLSGETLERVSERTRAPRDW
jgi:CBS domain-containing protein